MAVEAEPVDIVVDNVGVDNVVDDAVGEEGIVVDAGGIEAWRGTVQCPDSHIQTKACINSAHWSNSSKQNTVANCRYIY